MTDERHFNTDDEMDEWLEAHAEDCFDELPEASEEEMPSGGRVVIVISSATASQQTTVATTRKVELAGAA